MFSSVFNAIHGVVTLFIGVFKICFKLISVSCSWALLLCIIVIFALSRYYRLRKPASNITERCFSSKSRSETDESIIEWWPIANRAACLDELENSKSAIEKCVAQKCRNILLDVEVTKCGHLVILHRQTLNRIDKNISNSAITLDDLKSLNIAKNHPLCEQHSPEAILHFDDLMHLLAQHESLNLFLLLAPTLGATVVPNLLKYFKSDETRFQRIVVCSRSPLIIYQLRKANPNLICALWLDRTSDLPLPNILLTSSFFSFVYGLLVRTFIAYVTGISAVFISKHDFNANVGAMWRGYDVWPIVYTVNLPIEKRFDVYERRMPTMRRK